LGVGRKASNLAPEKKNPKTLKMLNYGKPDSKFRRGNNGKK
jgi:hypothetical protein